MTTAGGRLVAIAGAGTAARLWRRAAQTGAAGTSASLLVFRSGLGLNTAAVHHMHDKTPPDPADASANAGLIVNAGRLLSR